MVFMYSVKARDYVNFLKSQALTSIAGKYPAVISEFSIVGAHSACLAIEAPIDEHVNPISCTKPQRFHVQPLRMDDGEHAGRVLLQIAASVTFGVLHDDRRMRAICRERRHRGDHLDVILRRMDQVELKFVKVP